MKESEQVQESQVEKEHKITEVHKVVEAQASKKLPTWFPWVAASVAVLLIAMVSCGIGYQIARRGTVIRGGLNDGMMRSGLDDRNIGGMGGYRNRGMMGGSVGEVTAISTDSITIKDTVRGGSVTYKIDSNTKVTENGAAKAASDIKTGNTVRVAATGADTTIATAITITTN